MRFVGIHLVLSYINFVLKASAYAAGAFSLGQNAFLGYTLCCLYIFGETKVELGVENYLTAPRQELIRRRITLRIWLPHRIN